MHTLEELTVLGSAAKEHSSTPSGSKVVMPQNCHFVTIVGRSGMHTYANNFAMGQWIQFKFLPVKRNADIRLCANNYLEASTGC